jgi:hypothetical protein
LIKISGAILSAPLTRRASALVRHRAENGFSDSRMLLRLLDVVDGGRRPVPLQDLAAFAENRTARLNASGTAVRHLNAMLSGVTLFFFAAFCHRAASPRDRPQKYSAANRKRRRVSLSRKFGDAVVVV